MNARVIIRTATRDDMEAIAGLRTLAILETDQEVWSLDQLSQWAGRRLQERTLSRILDGCTLLGTCGGRVVATASLDLDEAELVSLFVSPRFQRQGIGRRLVTEIERMAMLFGIAALHVEAARPAAGFFRACRYSPRNGAVFRPDPRSGLDCLPMTRAFPRRQTHYGARIAKLLLKTGIPADYGRMHRLKLQPESRELATIGRDTMDREQMLHPKAAMAWYALRNAALDDGVELQVASAFRSVGYQVSIIERKRQQGQSIGDILRVSAAPGFSEHHGGFAVDLTCPGTAPLEESFEKTGAFEWLAVHAELHGFHMSYPRDNRHGIAYEPWHWRFKP